MRKDKNRIRDHYFNKAKQEKYPARSVYKLKDIQDKWKLLQPAHRVLDLGAAPGSWTEYVLKILDKNGELWAVDERALSENTQNKIKNAKARVHFLEQSIFADLPEELPKFDVILSDMAPWTGGNKIVDSTKQLELIARAFELAAKQLKSGGHFVTKVFQSPDADQLTKSWKTRFKMSKLFRPPSVKKESKEIYFVGQNFQS